MELECESRDDAEISAATAKRPEQVRVFISACLNKVAIGQYDIGREEIIDTQPKFASEMPDSTAKSQSADASGRNDSAWRCEAEYMRCVIDVSPGASAPDNDRARFRIDTCIFYRAEVDDQSVVADSQAPRVMSAAADRHEQIVLSSEVHGGNDVRHVRTTGNQPRLFVDHSVVHLTSFIVILVTRFDQSATKVHFEIRNCILAKHDEVSAKRSYGQDSEVSIF